MCACASLYVHNRKAYVKFYVIMGTEFARAAFVGRRHLATKMLVRQYKHINTRALAHTHTHNTHTHTHTHTHTK